MHCIRMGRGVEAYHESALQTRLGRWLAALF